MCDSRNWRYRRAYLDLCRCVGGAQVFFFFWRHGRNGWCYSRRLESDVDRWGKKQRFALLDVALRLHLMLIISHLTVTHMPPHLYRKSLNTESYTHLVFVRQRAKSLFVWNRTGNKDYWVIPLLISIFASHRLFISCPQTFISTHFPIRIQSLATCFAIASFLRFFSLFCAIVFSHCVTSYHAVFYVRICHAWAKNWHRFGLPFNCLVRQEFFYPFGFFLSFTLVLLYNRCRSHTTFNFYYLFTFTRCHLYLLYLWPFLHSMPLK